MVESLELRTKESVHPLEGKWIVFEFEEYLDTEDETEECLTLIVESLLTKPHLSELPYLLKLKDKSKELLFFVFFSFG